METNQNNNPNQQQQQQQQYGQPSGSQQYQQHYYNYMPTDNLSTFATLHLVKGILTILFSLFFLLYMFIGTAMTFAPMQGDVDMPFHPGNIFVIIGGIGFLITVTIGILTLLAGKYIKERRNYNFIFAIAIINCITGVLGIVLGIFTILDLNKPHVQAQFQPGYDPLNPLGNIQ
ncbi:hypothetical protein [Nonlabens sp. Asnod3-A02]|uniref:hypothetical protein n=1 Tax=Nonlabens sp. Asnod3-A02 TaxID=3160579 RepID=UPI00386BEA3E